MLILSVQYKMQHALFIVFSGGSRRLPHPQKDQNFLNFVQFFWKFWQNCMLMPQRVSAPPMTAGPTTGFTLSIVQLVCVNRHSLSSDWFI